MAKRDDNTRRVYSTATGDLRTSGTKRSKPGKKKQQAPPQDGIVRIQRDSKGRRGKTVTIITGLPLSPNKLSALATELKKKCGTGGTSKNGVIEIQGDHRERLQKELEQAGYTAKLAGG